MIFDNHSNYPTLMGLSFLGMTFLGMSFFGDDFFGVELSLEMSCLRD